MILSSMFNTVIVMLFCFTENVYGQVSCGGNVIATPEDTSLTLPTYPNNYYNNMDCTYMITAPEGGRVYLTTSSIDAMRMEISEFCSKDFILVIDGASPNGPVITRACEFYISVLSTGRHLTVLFHSDGDTTSRGFHLLYRTVNNTEACPKQHLNAFKTDFAITSPFYPMNYPNNTECEWRISAPKDHVVYIEVEKSSLQQSDQCMKDYVQVYDGVHKNGGFTIGKWCGDQLPSPIHSSTIFMAIVFHSDDQISAEGFRVLYSARPKSDFPDRPKDRGLVVAVMTVVIVIVVIVVVVGVACIIRRRKSRRSNIA